MNWHQPTEEEINGDGDHRFLIDVIPDVVPHQAARDGDALVRIARPGWSWSILDRVKRKDKRANVDDWFIIGMEDTREAAIGAMFSKLSEIR